MKRGRPRAEDKLREIALLAARGLQMTEIAEETASSYRQVRTRIATIRSTVASTMGDLAWLEGRTVVEAANAWLKLNPAEDD